MARGIRSRGVRLFIWSSFRVTPLTWWYRGYHRSELARFALFRDRGVEVNVVFIGLADGPRLKHHRSFTSIYLSLGSPRRFVASWCLLSRLTKEDEAKGRPMVMTSQSNGIISLLAFFKMFSLPLIARYGYTPWRLHWKAGRPLRALMEVIVGLSGMVLASRITHTEPINASILFRLFTSKARRIRNAIGVSRVPVDPITPLDERPIDVLFVGRISSEKRIVEFCTSLERVSPGTSVTLVGSIDAGQERYASGLHALSKVDHLGRLSHRAVLDLMEKSKFLVLPSVSEGVPKVVLEAGLSGCVPAMTSFPFSEEVFASSGLVADGPNALAERVASFLGGSAAWDELQRTVLQICGEFGLDSAVESEMTVIEELMGIESSR